MDPCEEDSVVLQPREEDPSVLPTGSPDLTGDQETQETQDQEGLSADEYDTDLEADDGNQSLSRADLYLQVCQQMGANPVSSVLRQLGDASLNLNHCGLGPLGAKVLSRVLQGDAAVINLELEDNALQVEGTRHLMEMLQSNISIQSLNLSNNQLYLRGADFISKMLVDNYYIKSIRLSGNGFDDSAAKYLAESLKGDYVVKELDLSDNKICEAGGEHLGQMLATNVGIEILNLNWNHLRMHGAVCLSAGLKLNSTLKELHLSWNGFGPVEAESLGQALKQNNTLVLLDLSSNRIQDQAVALLCQGLTANSTLKVLKLSQNPMTSSGALTLLKMLQHNVTSAVQEMDISTVFVCEAFVELLEEVRRRRPALDVRFSVMTSVTRNLSALQIFQKFLEKRNESLVDFFQALDEDGTMKVSTFDFRKALKAANAPLDQRQIEWLIRKFDKKCTATINYSQFSEAS